MREKKLCLTIFRKAAENLRFYWNMGIEGTFVLLEKTAHLFVLEKSYLGLLEKDWKELNYVSLIMFLNL